MFFIHYFTKGDFMVFNENILYDDNNNIIIKSFHSKVAPGKRAYREHHHTECELSIFISGSGTYTANDKTYNFTSGDIFLFGSDETHCITEILSETELLNIHFEPRIFWENVENTELLKLFFDRNASFKNKIVSSDSMLKDIILNIESEIEKKLTGYKIKAKYTLFSALIYIMRNFDYINNDKTYCGKNMFTLGKLKEAMAFIDNNISEKITLKEIADIACMTQTYFSAVFKKMNGISPWEYITIKRIEKSIYYLKTTSMTKIEIAEKCGFSSSSNFYKAFSRITGKAPGDYSL